MPGPQPVIPTSGLKPQSRAQEPQKIDDLKQPVPQKKSVPVLEKHLVYQLSKEEQDALNSKFQEATDADKKVLTKLLCLFFPSGVVITLFIMINISIISLFGLLSSFCCVLVFCAVIKKVNVESRPTMTLLGTWLSCVI